MAFVESSFSLSGEKNRVWGKPLHSFWPPSLVPWVVLFLIFITLICSLFFLPYLFIYILVFVYSCSHSFILYFKKVEPPLGRVHVCPSKTHWEPFGVLASTWWDPPTARERERERAKFPSLLNEVQLAQTLKKTGSLAFFFFFLHSYLPFQCTTIKTARSLSLFFLLWIFAHTHKLLARHGRRSLWLLGPCHSKVGLFFLFHVRLQRKDVVFLFIWDWLMFSLSLQIKLKHNENSIDWCEPNYTYAKARCKMSAHLCVCIS